MGLEYKPKHLAAPADHLAPLADDDPDGPDHMGHSFGPAMKVFGVLSIVSGLQNVGTYAFVTLFLGLVTAGGWALERYSTVTLALFAVTSLLLMANAAAQVVLGVRLLRGKNRRVALACELKGTLQGLLVACYFMVEGLSANVASSVASIIFLAILQAYADPSLRREREESREDAELSVVPPRLRRPGAVVLEVDDEDPAFDVLDLHHDELDTDPGRHDRPAPRRPEHREPLLWEPLRRAVG